MRSQRRSPPRECECEGASWWAWVGPGQGFPRILSPACSLLRTMQIDSKAASDTVCMVHKYKGQEPPSSSPILSPPWLFIFPTSLTQAFDPAQRCKRSSTPDYPPEEYQSLPLKHRTAWRSQLYTNKTTHKLVSPLARGRHKTRCTRSATSTLSRPPPSLAVSSILLRDP